MDETHDHPSRIVLSARSTESVKPPSMEVELSTYEKMHIFWEESPESLSKVSGAQKGFTGLGAGRPG